MQVTVRLFAGLKERFGPQLEEGFEADAITVAELCSRIATTRPDLAPHLPSLAVAINQEYVRDFETRIREGDEVALISPISGGAGDDPPHFRVTPDVLDAHALRDLVRTDASGAVIVFEGVVRDRHEGHEVLRLEYDAYPEMAERVLREVAEAVRAEFPIHDIAIHHRTGTLEIGEASLVVAVSAEHRAEAFAAAERAVDAVKASVPVWKREHGPDGAMWQEGAPARPVR